MMKHSLAILVLMAAVLLAGCRTTGTSAVVDAYGNKDYVGALQLSEERIRGGTANKVDRVLHAWSLFQLGYLDRALDEFRQISRKDQSNFHGWLGQAWIMMKKGGYEQVPPFLDEAERWMGQWQRPMLYAARGWLAFYQGDLERAEKFFGLTEAALYFEDAEYIPIPLPLMRTWKTLPWVGRGWVAVVRGDLAEAGRSFLRGLEHDPSCHLCYAGLAEVASRQGETNEAIQFATRGLSLTRHDRELTDKLNRLLWKKNDPELSMKVYRELVDSSKGDPLYRANLGYLYLYRGQFDKALDNFQQALRDEPGQPLASRGLVEVRRALRGGRLHFWTEGN